MEFEWDSIKNELNFKKHSVWFEEAQTVWADGGAIEFYDFEHSSSEDRFLRIGFSTASRLLLVVFCERENPQVVRIISARKATAKEQKQYEERI